MVRQVLHERRLAYWAPALANQVKVILVGGLGHLPKTISVAKGMFSFKELRKDLKSMLSNKTNNRIMMGQCDMSLSSWHYPEIAIPSTSSISFKLFMKQTLP